MDVELSGRAAVPAADGGQVPRARGAAVRAQERAERDEPPFSRGYWRQAAELGLAAVLVPEEFGGIGPEQPVLDLVIVAEEMGRQIAPGPLLPVSVVADALVRSGSADQQRQYLPALADGSLLAAWAMGEAPDQWEPAEGTTSARPDGPDWVLTGQKASVEAADVADVLLVTARTAAAWPSSWCPATRRACPSGRCPSTTSAGSSRDVDLDEVRLPARRWWATRAGSMPSWSTSTCWP